MLQTGRQLERVHVAEAEGWLMTGMYFMAKIKEPCLRSAALRNEKRQRAKKRARFFKPDKTSSGIQSHVVVIII